MKTHDFLHGHHLLLFKIFSICPSSSNCKFYINVFQGHKRRGLWVHFLLAFRALQGKGICKRRAFSPSDFLESLLNYLIVNKGVQINVGHFISSIIS